MNPRDEPPKVSTLFRILAGVFVFCGVSVIAHATVQAYLHKNWSLGLGGTALMLLGALFYGPLFFFVVLRGQPPRWWASIEEILNKNHEFQRRGGRLVKIDSLKRLAWSVAAVVFGLFLFYLGNLLKLFADENRWFSITVFALAWLISMVFAWLYFGKNPASRNNNLDGKDR